MATTWGSKNAEDLFRIATRIAGFDATDLMTEINRRSKADRVNEATVSQAMKTISDRQKAAA